MIYYWSATRINPHADCWKRQSTAICSCQMPRCPMCGKPEPGTIACREVKEWQ